MDIFLSNKYTKIYFSIIDRARSRIIPRGCYNEKHHIIPKSIGGLNTKENMVRLTAKEHYVCHRLLVRMTNGVAKSKMAFAIFRFHYRSKHHLMSPKITSRAYQTIKEDFSRAMSFIKKGKQPYKMTDEVRKNMSIAAKQRPPRQQSQEEKSRRCGSGNARALTWHIERQSGGIEIIQSLKTWCAIQNIVYTSLIHTLKSSKFYKGYRIIKKI